MISRANREIIIWRSDGVCEICAHARATNMHHRRPRGMGGTTRNIHTPAWILHVCGSGTTGCHGYIEGNRTLAYRNGWLLRANQIPATTPAWIRGTGFVILNDDGRYEPWGSAWEKPDTKAMPGAPSEGSSYPRDPWSATFAGPTLTTD